MRIWIWVKSKEMRIAGLKYGIQLTSWPSDLRRCVKAAVFLAWVRIPPKSYFCPCEQEPTRVTHADSAVMQCWLRLCCTKVIILSSWTRTNTGETCWLSRHAMLTQDVLGLWITTCGHPTHPDLVWAQHHPPWPCLGTTRSRFPYLVGSLLGVSLNIGLDMLTQWIWYADADSGCVGSLDTKMWSSYLGTTHSQLMEGAYVCQAKPDWALSRNDWLRLGVVLVKFSLRQSSVRQN